ncbi:MAG: hypothetical protein CMJ20_08525 [Phycisphaeraceae bacterium]|nr:hypothetical protein [Phycisphaeraceae bacterium]|tara:strand:- start:400 stop:2541 length:2142 start_codon:yes stop_codon:yes gene_type:complete
MCASAKLTLHHFGRAHHLRIDSAKDLANVLLLDEAHWVATSAPINTIRGDAAFLELIDSDHDGRIRVCELRDAVIWTLETLTDYSGLEAKSTALQLSAINCESSDGQRIFSSAEKIINRLGSTATDCITLSQIRQIKSEVQQMPVSEAGITLPDAAADEQTSQFIKDVVDTVGGASHPCGKAGVGQEQLGRFCNMAKAYLEWVKTKEQDAGELLPLGEKTEKAFKLFSDLRSKIDQYFFQCQILALDSRMIDQIPPRTSDAENADLGDSQSITHLMAIAPLARPCAERTLDCKGAINPHFVESFANLHQHVLKQLLDEDLDHLTECQWETVKKRLMPYEKWCDSKPEGAFAKLGVAKLQGYLDGSCISNVRHLIDQSHETAFQLDNIRLIEKLLLYQSCLLELANNFVSFPDLYDPTRRAVFEMGTLVMDGRRFNMAVKVIKRADHAKVTALSSMFVLYIRVNDHRCEKPYELAVPVTSGGKGGLVVGKRGVFNDIDECQWDAQVIQIIENPISLNEAMFAPFKRIGQLVTGKIEQLTSGAEKKLDTATQQSMSNVEKAVTDAETSKVQHQAVQQRGLLAAGGLLAGGGVALAAVGSALAYIADKISQNPTLILGGLGGAILAVLLPSILLAVLKLRRRDLSAILEGSGWAINLRMRLSRSQSHSFTRMPRYPRGTKGLRGFRFWVINCIIVGIVVLVVGLGTYYLWIGGFNS